MTLAREPWDDSMANGFSAPQFTMCVDWALRLAAKVVDRDAVVAHDRAYYEGGTLDDKLVADVVLFSAVLLGMNRAGETREQSFGAACAVFRGLQTIFATSHFYRHPTVQRVEQEA